VSGPGTCWTLWPRYLPDSFGTRPRFLGDSGPGSWMTHACSIVLGGGCHLLRCGLFAPADPEEAVDAPHIERNDTLDAWDQTATTIRAAPSTPGPNSNAPAASTTALTSADKARRELSIVTDPELSCRQADIMPYGPRLSESQIGYARTVAVVQAQDRRRAAPALVRERAAASELLQSPGQVGQIVSLVAFIVAPSVSARAEGQSEVA
jgi:hypothetical protein